MKKENKLRIIHLCVAVLLTAALAVSLGLFAAKTAALNTELGAVYDAAYFALVDNLGDLENKLKKLDVASGGKLQRELLEGVYTDSEVAVGHIDDFASILHFGAREKTRGHNGLKMRSGKPPRSFVVGLKKRHSAAKFFKTKGNTLDSKKKSSAPIGKLTTAPREPRK